MTDALVTSYDDVPYASLPFAQSHPDRLNIVASLLGLSPAPIENCKVLEVGCAAGGNLIPMAMALPGSLFVGIDLSGRQIADGRDMLKTLGVTNASLEHMSLTDMTPEFGQFDYIIAHGVYTWVPPEVKDALLRLCKRNLAPNGVAYVSYNVYPGWHMRGMIRDMMRYHTSRFTDASAKVAQARGLLNFLTNAVPGRSDAYSMLLNTESKILSKAPDYYLLHEHLEDINEPLYFYQFIERANKHGLQYLAESIFASMADTVLPANVVKTLSQVAFDTVSYEQYLDFVKNRAFRQTLLVHDDLTIKRKLNWKDVTRFNVRTDSNLKPVSEKPVLAGTQVEKFQGSTSAAISSGFPIVKAALSILHQNDPLPIPFSKLLSDSAHKVLKGQSDRTNLAVEEQQLAGAIIQAYTVGLVELTQLPPQFVRETTWLRPTASRHARAQAKTSSSVGNLLHQTVGLTPPQRHILQLLNGENDRELIAKSLKPLIEDGRLKLDDVGSSKPLMPSDKVLRTLVDHTVDELGRRALLTH